MASRKEMSVTRQRQCCPIFGMPKELSGKNLPTYEDMLRSCFEESYKASLLSLSKKKVEISLIADSVATQIEILYCKASIPMVTHKRVVHKIKTFYDAYKRLKKSYQRDKEKENYKKKVDAFVCEAKSKLFDIASCKCVMTCSHACWKKGHALDCPVIVKCNCEKDKQIPLIERKFLYDQRTTRFLSLPKIEKLN